MTHKEHETQGHKTTRYSPNGIDIIEECECGRKWMHKPSNAYPLPLPIDYKAAAEYFARIDAKEAKQK